MTSGQFGNRVIGIKIFFHLSRPCLHAYPKSCTNCARRQKFYKMHFWKRLVEINSLSILLRDNREHHHFIVDEYNSV